MRFLRRKSTTEIEQERCPYCREPVSDDAVECMMCGAALPQSRTESEEAGERADQDSNLRPTG